MSGLETLPPDQRAVLHLILQQGRGYADLAGMLKLDASAVRERALAGIEALAEPGSDALAPEQRGRIADYLLGQQDATERIVTFAELAESTDACRWAQGLRERLVPLARDGLPEVPAGPTTNGQVAALAPVAAPPPREPSRVGGMILIGGAVVVLIAVLAFALIALLDNSGGDGKSSAATATTAAQTTATTTTPTTTTAPQATVVAQVNLHATPGNGSGIGLGIVERGKGGKQAIAIQAQKLAPNGQQDIYAAWLQGPPGAHFLGFVPARVDKSGSFTASASLPGNAKSYSSVLITREATTAVPKQPGPTILSGALKLP